MLSWTSYKLFSVVLLLTVLHQPLCVPLGLQILFLSRKIEEKQGVAVTDSGIPELKVSPVVNGLQTEALRIRSSIVASSTKSSSSWDEDWGPVTKGTATSVQNSIDTSSQSVSGNPVGQVTSLQTICPYLVFLISRQPSHAPQWM